MLDDQPADDGPPADGTAQPVGRVAVHTLPHLAADRKVVQLDAQGPGCTGAGLGAGEPHGQLVRPVQLGEPRPGPDDGHVVHQGDLEKEP